MLCLRTVAVGVLFNGPWAAARATQPLPVLWARSQACAQTWQLFRVGKCLLVHGNEAPGASGGAPRCDLGRTSRVRDARFGSRFVLRVSTFKRWKGSDLDKLGRRREAAAKQTISRARPDTCGCTGVGS